MTNPDQWYYLDGSETRGPVPAAQVVQLIRAGSLSAASQVAQAGWQTWSPASVALANLLGGAQPGAAAVEPPTYAIRVQCVSGPDAGKAYMISAPEVSLGRVSGIGQNDPSMADNHVVLSWQNNVLYFRTFPGSKIRVAGVEVTQGTLSNGQQFQMGLSNWQVGSAPIELTNLLGNLGSRINKLTATDKLEGFSLGAMFSETFKGRKAGEVEDYFVVGTSKTTPPIDEVQTGWPKPWFYMRVLLFMAALYFAFYKMFDIFGNPKLAPGLMVMGSFVVPLATVILFWELNTPRNVPFSMVLVMLLMGGAVSLFVASIGFDTVGLNWLSHSRAGIIEETGKLLAVIIVARNTKYKYMLNGLLFGAAVGGGFAAFETAGYSFDNGFVSSFLRYFLKNPEHKGTEDLVGDALTFGYSRMIDIINSRSYDAPITHAAWTAISACAFWRVKGDQKFKPGMLIDPSFLRTFAIPVALHMIWNSPFFDAEGFLGYLKPLVLGIIAWYVIFSLVQQGLKQVRDMQVAQAQTEYNNTAQILTTTGRFRAQQTVN